MSRTTVRRCSNGYCSSRYFASAFLIAALACSSGQGDDSQNDDSTAKSGSESTADDDDDDDDNDVGESDQLLAPRILRLTHSQWENTVRDLFAFPEALGLADAFRVDPGSTFLFANDYDALEVDEALWHGYRIAAAQVATTVSADPAILDAIAPERDSDATAFLTRFGRSALRRPVQDEELAMLAQVFSQGPSFYPDMSAGDAGVRMIIETLLQSPHFLYRLEFADPDSDDKGPPVVDDWTLAQRMSYLLWNSLPDNELLDATALGELATPGGIATQTQRMLEDPRAEMSLAVFHRAIFEIERVRSAHPLADLFPNFSPQTIDAALREHDLFIRNVVNDEHGSFTDLLTSRTGAVNRELAQIYGLDGEFSDDEFKSVTFDVEQRSGILTQIAFLAGHATSVDPDSIHRGAFLARSLACVTIASPPNNVPPLPEIDNMTNRQAVEAHTEVPQSGCDNCHAEQINPFGFPFENYDAIGAYRLKDHGFSINAATKVLLDGEKVAVGNALELATALASSQQVHRCYAKHWLEYVWGRRSDTRDHSLIDTLASQSLQDNLSVHAMIEGIVTSAEFRHLNGVAP